ncbi:MAG: class I SAM-dependent methyltransferase [Myxococcota bacterium]|jgi:SAM-dependent methyltransferase
MARRDREQNRRSWNAATVAHNSHKGDQAAFLRRRGATTLFPEELELLGPLRGRRLLHLQCNAGQDTLSLAKRGARVTGVDLSDEAIDFARALARDSGISATFVRADVYDYLATPGPRFDVVFSSYGVTGWLEDLSRWARGIARKLVPGGRFVCVDFHPAAWTFDERGRPAFPYSTHGRPMRGPGVSDYVARSGDGLVPWGFEAGVRDFENPHGAVEYAWGLAEIIQALLDAGLVIDRLEEYPYANGCAIYEGMRVQGRRRYPGPNHPQVPLMFAVRALQPARARARRPRRG